MIITSLISDGAPPIIMVAAKDEMAIQFDSLKK